VRECHPTLLAFRPGRPDTTHRVCPDLAWSYPFLGLSRRGELILEGASGGLVRFSPVTISGCSDFRGSSASGSIRRRADRRARRTPDLRAEAEAALTTVWKAIAIVVIGGSALSRRGWRASLACISFAKLFGYVTRGRTKRTRSQVQIEPGPSELPWARRPLARPVRACALVGRASAFSRCLSVRRPVTRAFGSPPGPQLVASRGLRRRELLPVSRGRSPPRYALQRSSSARSQRGVALGALRDQSDALGAHGRASSRGGASVAGRLSGRSKGVRPVRKEIARPRAFSA